MPGIRAADLPRVCVGTATEAATALPSTLGPALGTPSRSADWTGETVFLIIEAIWSSNDGEFSPPDDDDDLLWSAEDEAGEGEGTALGFSEKYVSVRFAFSRRASETAASELMLVLALALAVGLEDCLRMLFPGTLFRVGLFGGDLIVGETICAVGAAAIAGEDVEEGLTPTEGLLVFGTPPTRELGTMAFLLLLLFEFAFEDS